MDLNTSDTTTEGTDSKPEVPDKNHGNNNQSNRTGQNRNKHGSYSITQTYKWNGKNEDLKSILALKSERYEQKVLYTTFTDNLKN